MLKFASIVVLGWTKCWRQIKGISRTKKKEARPASPLVVPVEAAPTLRLSPLPECNLYFWPKSYFVKILVYNLSRYCICSSYYCYTYDLNILYTRIDASVSFLRTRVWQNQNFLQRRTKFTTHWSPGWSTTQRCSLSRILAIQEHPHPTWSATLASTTDTTVVSTSGDRWAPDSWLGPLDTSVLDQREGRLVEFLLFLKEEWRVTRQNLMDGSGTVPPIGEPRYCVIHRDIKMHL
jgi:hypothetical protein